VAERQRVRAAWNTTAMQGSCDSRKIQMSKIEKTNLDVLLEASFKNCTGPLKERLARKGSRSTAQFLLDETKATVQELDPDLDPTDPKFHTAVILMAATFVVGPRVDLLVEFTGYSVMVVAQIARRMRECSLWGEGEVDTDDWLDGEKILDMYFWLHRLVADGLVQANRTEDGKMLYSAIKTTKQN
jgi:hypothetical protein